MIAAVIDKVALPVPAFSLGAPVEYFEAIGIEAPLVAFTERLSYLDKRLDNFRIQGRASAKRFFEYCENLIYGLDI